VSPVFLVSRIVDGDDPVQVKFECKEGEPLLKQPSCNISPHNSETAINSEKSSINANKKPTMGFPTSYQPRSCVTPTFLKIGFSYPNLSFFAQNFEQKPLKVCYIVSLSKTCQRQSCSTINYLSNVINILAGDDLIKFGPKSTDPQ